MDLPIRPSGYVLISGYLIASMGWFLYQARQKDFRRKIPAWQAWGLLILLLLLAPLSVKFTTVRLPIIEGLPTPGLPRAGLSPDISLLGALPWMLAGGILGGWQAALIGLASGIASGYWQTYTLITPLHFLLSASLFTWLITRNYDDRFGKALRHPLVSAVLLGVVFGMLRTVELFAYSAGDLYDGIDIAYNNLLPAILGETLMFAVAGGVCEAAKLLFPQQWFKPRWKVPGPYNRSLAGRMVTVLIVIGVIASTILLAGDWLLARSSASELIETQMQDTAAQAGGAIPYFIQTGRSLMGLLGDEVSTQMGDMAGLQQQLDRGLRLVPFFYQLAIYDTSGEIILRAPSEGYDFQDSASELAAGVQSALQGVPQEIVLSPRAGGEAARLVFLIPIRSPNESQPTGVVAGYTELDTNPFLLPTVIQLEEISPGSAYITDDLGTIVIHPDPDRLMTTSDLELNTYEAVEEELSPSGVRRLVYAHTVRGYPWYVVVTKPLGEVDRLAIRLALRSFAVISAIGAIFIGLVYAISRQLTRPLRLMAKVAETIARGNLEEPVPRGGQDEIGRLSASFEHMRKSLRSRLAEMDLLLEVSQRFASSFHLDEVLPPILEGVRKLTSANMARLVLVPEGEALESRFDIYSSGVDPGRWKELDHQIVDLCQQRGNFILENPARAKAVLNMGELEEPIEALMALPISHEGRFTGALWLGHRTSHVFSEGESHLLSIVVGQLGVALANARLYQQAEEERLQLMAIIEATPDAVIMTNPDGVISLANPAAEVVLTVTAQKAHGKPAAEVISVPEIVDILTKSRQDALTREVEVEEGRIYFASVTRLEDSDLDDTGSVCVLWDITHYKKVDSLKSEFVSTVSHDLRTPLTMMRGYATMLSMVGTLNTQQRDYVRKILESSKRMSRRVDNLLDLGRIEAGLGLKLEKIQLKEVIGEVVSVYRPQAVNKQLTLDVEITEELEAIEADPTLLQQALGNLVENAIKFTPSKGRVIIRLDEQEERQRIQVKDTGVGIAPMDQARLFERFFRSQAQKESGEGSSGLGLAIAKSIVEQHRGRIYLESRLGSGSTFTIELPKAPAARNSALDRGPG